MSQHTRWLVLDGNDAGIYSGEWRSTLDERAFRGTLMTAIFNISVANDSNAIMNFTFDGAWALCQCLGFTHCFSKPNTGTSVILHGQSNPSAERESPRFPACTVDGEPANLGSLGSSGIFTYSWNSTNATNHTLQLSAEPQAGPVSVDSIWFLPRYNSRVPENSLVEFRHDHPRLDFTSGDWQTLEHDGSNATSTTAPNSSLTFVFTGMC